MSYVSFGKKKSQYLSVLTGVFTMPIIAILTFLGVVPLEPAVGWLAAAVFVVSLFLLFTKFKNAKFGMKKGDEKNFP
ncbi:hypothetical protein KFZ56_18115 [Virgibacillus sp. NKC19-3]|uniref:hypothetical protein n=1 Tax=Virgibacillus saliphilus TaxID=2831674 RepID=UPI001C9B51E2|nr:hypothetical protein [Virgibacillus sp. NKC19-3]MBY7144935.1 hypothetical protein [Virgibacillus sp. NKC19-3]